MKKIFILLFLYTFFILPIMNLELQASITADYLSYSEVVLNTGKLIRDFTKEEINALAKRTDGTYFYQIVIAQENQEVIGTYVSNTLFSADNRGQTDIEYNVDVQVETNMKVSFTANGSVAVSGSGKLNDVKKEASAKAGLEYNKTTSSSVKEKQSLSIIIEPNSRAIIYLTGDLAISNGYVAVYGFFYKKCGGCYEFVTLKSQYARIEKISL